MTKHLPLISFLFLASLHLCPAWLTFEQQDQLERHLPANEARFGTAIRAKLVIEKARVLALPRLGDPFYAFKDVNEIVKEAPKVFAKAIEWREEQIWYYGRRMEDDMAARMKRIRQKGQRKKEDLDAKRMILNREGKMGEIDRQTEEEVRQLTSSDFYAHLIGQDKERIAQLEKYTEWAKELIARNVDLERELARLAKAINDNGAILYAAEQYGFEMPKRPEGYLYEVHEFEVALENFQGHEKRALREAKSAADAV